VRGARATPRARCSLRNSLATTCEVAELAAHVASFVTRRRGTLAARARFMARPQLRDLITWSCTVPASVVLVVCLFLPQVRDCSGDIKTPVDTNTAPLMLMVAAVGVVPILWRCRALQKPLLLVTGIATACVLIVSVFGIPVLIILALSRTMTDEEAVAMCCFTLVLAFVMVFPIAMMFGDWRRGAELTWAASWFQLFGTIWWAGTAANR
jgi:hypothetical protein